MKKESSANEKESSANEKESSEVEEARDAVRHMLELKKRGGAAHFPPCVPMRDAFGSSAYRAAI